MSTQVDARDPGEIPNPEDQNDRGSRSGFDGNAAEKIALDDDEGEEGSGPDQNRTKDPDDRQTIRVQIRGEFHRRTRRDRCKCRS